MKAYRNIKIEDLKFVDGKLTIYPKQFKSNNDSSMPDGCYSFWFDEPIIFHPHGTECIVEADIEPMTSGKMRFSRRDNGDDYLIGEIREYVCDYPVVANRIWINYLYVDSQERNRYDYVTCQISGITYYDNETIDYEIVTDLWTVTKSSMDRFGIMSFYDTDGSDGQEFSYLTSYLRWQ